MLHLRGDGTRSMVASGVYACCLASTTRQGVGWMCLVSVVCVLSVHCVCVYCGRVSVVCVLCVRWGEADVRERPCEKERGP